MSEATLIPAAIRQSALEEVHLQMGATMSELDGYRVPEHYGNPAGEYEAVRNQGCGIIDLSSRGRMLISGSEAVQFLNGLITNDIKALDQHRWMRAAFANVQGRLLAVVRIFRLSDETNGDKSTSRILLDTEAATHERIFKHLERFTLAGDFKINDVTETLALISIQGKGAREVVDKMFGGENWAGNAVVETKWRGSEITIIPANHVGEDGFDLFVDASAAKDLWEALGEAGAQPIGYQALEILRIEAGIPRHGIDMDDSNVVSELNLDDAISFTKGCYLGQEIVIRIAHRGHVAKKLTGIRFSSDEKVPAGASISSNDGKEIGWITSTAYSPSLKQRIALGFVKFDFLANDTVVRVEADGNSMEGLVSNLPFIDNRIDRANKT